MPPSCYNDRLRSMAWEQLASRAEYHAPRLAALAKVSTKTLERFFKKHFKVTPQRWLDRLRQANAERMALGGARTKEIAFQLGYRQPSHFCKKFKQSHGLPAKAWSAIARPTPVIQPMYSNPEQPGQKRHEANAQPDAAAPTSEFKCIP